MLVGQCRLFQEGTVLVVGVTLYRGTSGVQTEVAALLYFVLRAGVTGNF